MFDLSASTIGSLFYLFFIPCHPKAPRRLADTNVVRIFTSTPFYQQQSSLCIGASLAEMTPEFEELIRGYWARGLGDKKIQQILLDEHIDTSKYSLRYVFNSIMAFDVLIHLGKTSYESFRKMRLGLGLKGARQQDHTVESIHSTMLDIRDRHPNAGVSDLKNLLRVESEGGELQVPRYV